MNETGYVIFMTLGLAAVLIFLFWEGESIVKDFSARKSVKQQQERIAELEEELERSKDVITNLNNRIDKGYVKNLMLKTHQANFRNDLLDLLEKLVDFIDEYPEEEEDV